MGIKIRPELVVKYLYAGGSEYYECSKEKYNRENSFNDKREEDRRTILGFKCNDCKTELRVLSSSGIIDKVNFIENANYLSS